MTSVDQMVKGHSSEARLPGPNSTQPLLSCLTLSKFPASLYLVVTSAK